MFSVMPRMLGNKSLLRGLMARRGAASANGQKKGKPHDYSEDFFAETRMSFGDHIEVLRTHMLRALYGFMLTTCIGLWYGEALVAIIAQPIDNQLNDFHLQRM